MRSLHVLPPNPTLEAAIDDDDDDSTWSIYADFLQQHGVALGETLAQELAGRPHLYDTLTEHGRTLLGPALAAALCHAETSYAQNTDYVMWPAESFRVRWRHGFVDDLRLADYPVRCEDQELAHATMDELLHAVLASPGMRFLRGLTLGLWDEKEWTPTYEHVLEALFAAPQRRALRRFTIGDVYHVIEHTDDPSERFAWPAIGGSLARIWTSFPNLTSLVIRGTGIELGTVAHERLVSLAIEAPGLDTAISLATARLPALRTLRVLTGWGDQRGRLDDALRLVDRTPELEELALGGCQLGEDLIDVIRKRGPKLRKLATLRLPNACLHATHAAAISELRKHLPALRSIDLTDNHFLTGYDDDDDAIDTARDLLGATFDTVVYGDE